MSIIIKVAILCAILFAPIYYHFEIERGGNWSTQHIEDAISSTFVRVVRIGD